MVNQHQPKLATASRTQARRDSMQRKFVQWKTWPKAVTAPQRFPSHGKGPLICSVNQVQIPQGCGGGIWHVVPYSMFKSFQSVRLSSKLYIGFYLFVIYQVHIFNIGLYYHNIYTKKKCINTDNTDSQFSFSFSLYFTIRKKS